MGVDVSVPCRQILKLKASLMYDRVVRGIMVDDEPNICIADKSIKFGRDVCFSIPIRKKFGPTRKSTPGP